MKWILLVHLSTIQISYVRETAHTFFSLAMAKLHAPKHQSSAFNLAAVQTKHEFFRPL